jgi:putative ABC transport system ATP-binding protein
MDCILELRNVNKSYKMGSTGLQVLQNVNFRVENNDLLVIAGPSGSGKTTLLNLCGLIDRMDSGQLIFGEDDVSDASDKLLTKIRKKKIGFVFQSFNLIPVLSAYENVEFPLLLLNFSTDERKKLVKKYLEKVGLWERRKHKPSQLSGGEQQRVAMARALVKQPALIIADEPTANLDSHNTYQIIELIKKLNQEEQMTFVIASHDPIVIENCLRVVKIRDGILES